MDTLSSVAHEGTGLLPFIVLQMYVHPLIWVASLWAITFPGTTRSLALLFELRDEMGRPFWSGWHEQRD